MKAMVIYSLYKQQRKNSDLFYWYVKFKDPETGRFGSGKSVDSLARRLGDNVHHITKKPEAENIVQRAIAAGLYEEGAKDLDPLFVDYIQDFWDFEHSAYIRTENKLNPNSIGPDHARTCLGMLRNHAIPLIPKGLRCSQLKTRHLEAIQDSILSQWSVSVWLKTLQALKSPITELRRKKILLSDPLFDLKKIKAGSHKGTPKGCLTRRETDKLLFQMFNSCTYSHQEEHHYIHTKGKRAGQNYIAKRTVILDKRVYLATALASCSGMRMGEILALRTENIRFPNSGDDCENQAIIDIVEAYARLAKFKEPKGKKTREVPIPRWLADELIEFAATNPWNDGLVFYGTKEANTPFDSKAINKFFNRELEYMLGLQILQENKRPEAEDPDNNLELIKSLGAESRQQRNITFHSTRHYFDTQSFNTIGGEKTRLVIGHESEEMTQLYYSVSDEEILQIGTKTTRFITRPECKEA
ncbi:MAG: site-specific integrase [Sphaerochaetaceae bacterium]|nr:site-specific integrase [Sphaerochaetaceae bacterium]